MGREAGEQETGTKTADIDSKIHRIGTGKGTGAGKKVACKNSLEPFAMLMVARNDAVFFLFYSLNIRLFLSSKSKQQFFSPVAASRN